MARTLSLVALLVLSACSQGSPIDAGATFAGIAEDEEIELVGTEPFWGITIRPLSEERYEAELTSFGYPKETGPRTFRVARFAGNNGLGFSGKLDDEAVHIALTPDDCGDGMSDYSYPYAATVSWGEAVLRGCAYTSEAPFTGPEDP